MNDNNEIPHYDFLKGHDFTNNLKALLGCKNLQELSEVTGIPTSTFSTWNMKDRTSYELMIRIHLAHGIPMADLCLGYCTPRGSGNSGMRTIEEKTSQYSIRKELATQASHNTSFFLKNYDLVNGQLENRHASVFDEKFLEGFDGNELIVVKNSPNVFIVNTTATHIVSGLYLIAIDGVISLNQMQRMPAKQIAMSFNGSTLTVNEDDIKVVGKVITEIKRVTN